MVETVNNALYIPTKKVIWCWFLTPPFKCSLWIVSKIPIFKTLRKYLIPYRVLNPIRDLKNIYFIQKWKAKVVSRIVKCRFFKKTFFSINLCFHIIYDFKFLNEIYNYH